LRKDDTHIREGSPPEERSGDDGALCFSCVIQEYRIADNSVRITRDQKETYEDPMTRRLKKKSEGEELGKIPFLARLFRTKDRCIVTTA